MSPHGINSLVGDLVEMAKATERLPQLEQELKLSQQSLDHALQHNAGLEQNIIRYKEQIESLNDKVRSLEVERDDASFRVLEAEDREHTTLDRARTIEASVQAMIASLDPPKPEPLPEPQAQPVATSAEGQSALDPYQTGSSQDALGGSSVPEAVHSISETGQSESLPTSSVTSGEQKLEQTSVTSSANSDATSIDPGPALGPYFGKRYHDHPVYVPLHDWLDGGGTETDYYWRPVSHVGRQIW